MCASDKTLQDSVLFYTSAKIHVVNFYCIRNLSILSQVEIRKKSSMSNNAALNLSKFNIELIISNELNDSKFPKLN